MLPGLAQPQTTAVVVNVCASPSNTNTFIGTDSRDDVQTHRNTDGQRERAIGRERSWVERVDGRMVCMVVAVVVAVVEVVVAVVVGGGSGGDFAVLSPKARRGF